VVTSIIEDRMQIEKSIQLLKIGKQLIPGGSTFNKTTFFDRGKTPYGLEKGKGTQVYDVDGNVYTDFINGLGSVILGYGFDVTNHVILEQLEKGICFPGSNPWEQEVAQKLVDTIPCAEMVRYGKNGSDVISAATKLARHITDRGHIIFCGYHGWHDWVISKTSMNGGIPQAVQNLSHKFMYNDINSLHKIIKNLNGEVSCVVMDVVARYYPEPGFLEDVRELTKKHNILLIFDEIITGFRIHTGGAQKYFNVIPDLACFGKAIGNGMPISAVVGKEEYMSKFEEIFYALNFASESLSLATASATIDYLKKMDVPNELHVKGNYLIKKLEDTLLKYGLEGILAIQGMAPRPIIGFQQNLAAGFLEKKDEKIEKIVSTIVEGFAQRGILCNTSIFLSHSHTYDQLDHFLKSFDEISVGIREIVDSK